MKRREFTLVLAGTALASLGGSASADDGWNIAAGDDGWIDASTASLIKATDDQEYGYLWCSGHATARRRTVRWIGALGRGGQSIRIVPELDLVVAVTAGYYQDYSPQAFKVQYGVFSDVLQAVLPTR
jgi:CubicO group peptidase (beta-lactamase class C family)